MAVAACGPDSSTEPSGSDDAADTGACETDVDGGCTCNFKGNSAGVCEGAEIDPEAGGCAEPDTYESTETSCGDGLDNDCDGDVDCADSDCIGKSCGMGDGTAECSGNTCAELDCTDGKDNDGDGDIDCRDSSCTGNICESGEDWTCPAPEKFEDDESTCDGIDNDCDGTTDEGCGCTYDPMEERNVDTDDSHTSGICTNQSVGEDGACAKPSSFEPRTDAEMTCMFDDNDCDGAVDEGCACVYDPNESGDADSDGTHESGVCQGQTRDEQGMCPEPPNFEFSQKDSETGTSCEGAQLGTDNDCDGRTDEGCPCFYDPSEPRNLAEKGSGSGVCAGQTVNSAGTSCEEPTAYDSTDDESSAGLCDGLDNDCDGAIDEGCTCTYDPMQDRNIDGDGSHAQGVCADQTVDDSGLCQEPADFEASQGDAESGDSCIDDKDNDCDGVSDEGCPCAYDPGEDRNIDTDGSYDNGICSGQTVSMSGVCPEPTGFEPFTDNESSCDGMDNDCDGETDETDKGGGEPCTSDCDCNSGTCLGSGVCAHRIGVTIQKWKGSNIGGLSGADQKCQNAAESLGMRGNWKAVLSGSGQDAKDRLTISAAVYNSAGNKIADDASDLWDGTLQSGVDNCLTGTGICPLAWTGTDFDGTVDAAGNHCDDWSTGSAQGQVGDTRLTDRSWLESFSRSCDQPTYALYCIDGQ